MLWPKQVQLITMHSSDFQTKVLQSKCWLSAIEVWLGSMKWMRLRTNARCVVLVPCCGQDDYRAQANDDYTYKMHGYWILYIYLCSFVKSSDLFVFDFYGCSDRFICSVAFTKYIDKSVYIFVLENSNKTWWRCTCQYWKEDSGTNTFINTINAEPL